MDTLFTTVSLTIVCIVSIVVVLVALAVGYWAGNRRQRSAGEQKDSSIGSAVAATLGLLAFMLAFTFNMTAERFAERKTLLLDEVNAIETAFLRADFLDASGRDSARNLLADYARTRYFTPTKMPEEEIMAAIESSEGIHDQLWAIVSAHVDQGYDTEKLKAFYRPLNQVIDLHTKRLTVGGRYKIPQAIWTGLYLMTAVAMFGIGFQLGASNSGSLPLAVALSLAFATVILLVSDLDRPHEGFLTVNQRPMGDLRDRLLEATQLAPKPPP